MKTAARLHLSALLLTALVGVPLFAGAQQPAAKDVPPPPPPPEVQRLDESGEPGITVRQPETQNQITEQKQGGETKQIKVKRGKSTYYIKPGQPGGVVSGDAQSRQTNPAQWVVKEFGPGSTPPQPNNPPQTLPPAPPKVEETSQNKQ